jgi:hypothetical protein
VAKKTFALTSLMAFVVVGCGALPAAQPEPASPPPDTVPAPVETASAPAEISSTPADSTAKAFAPPKDPCKVLSARTRARLRLKTSEKDKRSPACQWSNDPGTAPPYKFRDLKITYDTGFTGRANTLEEAKQSFATSKRNDYRQPSVFGGTPSVKGEIKQIGPAKVGEDYDEGYYVYYVYEVAEAERGEGRAVLRKGNVIITISASGADVPGRRVRDGRPLGNAPIQAMIDMVAAEALAPVS